MIPEFKGIHLGNSSMFINETQQSPQSLQRKPLSVLINNIIQYNVTMNDETICTFHKKYR